MTTDLELKQFSSPLAIFFFLNSEEKHISHKKIHYEYFLNLRFFFSQFRNSFEECWYQPLLCLLQFSVLSCEDFIFFLLCAESSTSFFLN